ncbi:hypothetical protein ABPG75_012304 [Micractinium tetrahymenae]
MLARLARRRGSSLLVRALHGSRDLQAEADEPKKQEAPLVFAGRKQSESEKQLRYYVLKDELNPALSILQQALAGAPIPGKKPRFFSIPPPGVCNGLLMKAAEDHSQAGKAAEVAESLLQEGTPLEAHTLKALINSLARADELQAALPVLDAWLQQQEEALAEDSNTHGPLQVMSLLMDTATRAENTQMVLQVLARMARIGVTPSPQSLTTLLQCFMRLGQVQVAHTVLDWMRRNNLEPNVYNYTALLAMPRDLSEAGAADLLKQARSAYDKMRADGVEPNARFFTQLIRICGRAGNLAAAQEAWEDAKTAGVDRDLILYSAMIDTCAKCRDPAAAMSVFTEMKQGSRLQPDVVAYTSLLTALQGTPKAAEPARELWRSMQAGGVQPNGMAVAAFLEILLLEGEIDEALQTLAAAQPGNPGSSGERQGRKVNSWQRKSQRLLEAAGLEEELGAGSPNNLLGAPLTEGQAEEGGSGGEGGSTAAAVDLPRLYEHFLFAMAHKGQYAVVEQMARHMRARGLPHTLGTASALLTSQALQHGTAAAKWLLQPSSGGSASSAAALQLPDEAVESCLLGRGSPRGCVEKLLAGSSTSSSSSGGGSSKARGGNGALHPTTTANIILAGLAVRGCTADALRLFDWMKAQRGQQAQQGRHGSAAAAAAACAPDWWTHQLLLFAGLNAPKEQQLELTLRAAREAREFASGGGSGRRGPPWDGRTRAAIAAVMRQSEQARALLEAGAVDAAADERDERLAQLRELLS